MVEDGCLGGTRRCAVVVRRHRVEKLCADLRVEALRPFFDQPYTEVDVSEQAAFGGLPETRAALELARPADVVKQRRREQEVTSQPGMELRGLAAERGDADRVLEESARVAVMTVGAGSWEPSHPPSEVVVAEHCIDRFGQSKVGDLSGEELEEPVELVCVSPHRRHEQGRVRARRTLEGTHLELKAPAEALDPAEHAHGVAFGEASVEKLDVVPDARLDPTARVGEFEREVRSAVPRPATLLASHRVDPVDGPVFGELRDRRHRNRVYD